MGDIRQAVRSLLKTKLFTSVGILTLALGIGSTTAVFSLYHAIVLRPLPFADPGRLVDIEEWGDSAVLCAGCAVGLSRPTYHDYAARARAVALSAAYAEQPFNLGGGDMPERVSGALVSGTFFPLVGVTPAIGRGIDAGDDRPGAPRVVVLSEQVFRRRFGSDSTIVGQSIRLNGAPHTVVGVMPSTMVWPEFAQLWTALGPIGPVGDRGARELGVIGRLAPTATVATADAEAKQIAGDIERAHPETQRGWSARVRPFRSVLAGPEQSVYGVMLGAVIVLLLIVCANLAGLLLARGAARRRDIAVRLALGARRERIVWHLLAESLCLAVVGGVLGVIAASWCTDLLVASLRTQTPAWLEPRIDLSVLAFAVVMSAVSALAFGLVPALRASTPEIQGELKSGSGATVGNAPSALRGSLVVAQLSLSLILLTAAGVLYTTMQRISQRETGIDDRDVLQARVEFLDRPLDQAAVSTTQMVERLAAMAGARSAAAKGTGFIRGFGGRARVLRAEGAGDVPEGISPNFYFAVTPRYFETVRLSVVDGRRFDATDTRAAAPVVIVGQSLAKRLWPDGVALGRRIRFGPEDTLPWRTIVGLTADAFDTTGGRRSNDVYVPFAQAPQATSTILVGARGDPTALAPGMREVARQVDADLPLMDLMTVAQEHSHRYWPYRAIALTMAGFAAIALLLAAVGLYGVIAYSAEQRTREIGLRIALGARRRDVVRLMTKQAVRLVCLGLGLGLAGAAAVLPVMKSLLFGASPFNPTVFAAVAALLVAVALGASWLPARRAANVDPMVALRKE